MLICCQWINSNTTFESRLYTFIVTVRFTLQGMGENINHDDNKKNPLVKIFTMSVTRNICKALRIATKGRQYSSVNP